MKSHRMLRPRRLVLMALAAAIVMLRGDGHAAASPKRSDAGQTELERFMKADWTEIGRLGGVDAAVLSSLYSRIGGAGEISDAGGPFNAGDVAAATTSPRFRSAGRTARRRD